MKKLLLFALGLIGLTGISQNSFVVYRAGTSTSVSPNATLLVSTVPSTLTTVTLDMVNTSSTTNIYNVKRYDIVLHRNNDQDTSEARFCFASQCYGANVFTGIVTLTLAPNQNTGTMGDYYSLDCDYWEASTKAFALVKYTFFNLNSPGDTMQITIRYNNELFGVGIKEHKSQNSLSFYPNPAKDITTVSVSNTTDSQLRIYNSLGQEVYSRRLAASTGTQLNIDLSDYPSGVYIAELREGNRVSTKKLIIE